MNIRKEIYVSLIFFTILLLFIISWVNSMNENINISSTESVRYYDITGDKNKIYTNSATSLQENLVPNPSFEEGSGDLPDGWNYDNENDESVIFTWDSKYAFSGERSVGISHPKLDGSVNWYTTDFIPVNLIKSVYECSVFYSYINQPAVGQYGGLSLSLYDKDKVLLCTWGWCLPFSSDWKFFNWTTDEIEKEYLTKTKYVRVRLEHIDFEKKSNPLVEIRFDDVFFGVKKSFCFVEINNISGGFGISADIKNIGDYEIYNVTWSINVSGVVLIGAHTEGTISSLPPQGKEQIKSLVFGFGPAVITVTAEEASVKTHCFLVGPIVVLY